MLERIDFMKGKNNQNSRDGTDKGETGGYEFTEDDQKIMNYMMAKALLAAQVRKGLLAQESFDRMAQKIDLYVAHLDAK
jgi:hypothetical protein